MTIKLCPNTNPITGMYACMQLIYMFVNNNIHPQLIEISFICFFQYLKHISRYAGFISGGGAGGAYAPPMKVFAPPQELVELTY